MEKKYDASSITDKTFILCDRVLTCLFKLLYRHVDCTFEISIITCSFSIFYFNKMEHGIN